MIDYYETKSQPITRVMVWQAYKKVRANKGSGGVDEMRWQDLDKDLNAHLYRLWNRLTSGSYFPMPVREVEISKDGEAGVQKLGIPTILDRIAQEVAKTHLERIVEPQFHQNSYGYRPGKNCHQAVERASQNVMTHDWVIDLDIKGFFDNIDQELLMKAVMHYCKDKWILLYVKRWLKAGIIQKDGMYLERVSGTPQGGVNTPRTQLVTFIILLILPLF
jgi:RNA-directed DNA polymerase